MDVHPQLLREIEFHQQRRGYSPDEVDDFLERVAVAVGRLQQQLGEATARAERAERLVLEKPADESEVGRTLVLAQRTADAALDEARQQAAVVTAEADERAAAAVAEAEARAADIGLAADERAAAAVAEAEAMVASELTPLLAQRGALQGDVEAVRAWSEAVKASLADELRQQLARLDAGEIELPPPPEVLALEVPEPVGVTSEDRTGDLTVGGVAGADQPAADGDPVAPTGTSDGDQAAPADGARRDDGARDEPVSDDGPLAVAAADDPFLAELRRAMTDDEPLGPRDAAVTSDDVGEPEGGGRPGGDRASS